MKTIQLTQGFFALVDDTDWELVSRFKWQANRGRTTSAVYAMTTINKKGVLMHRLILGIKASIDHIDGNGLNNQRANLRACTNQQNQANRTKQAGARSIHKGVSFFKGTKKWTASISVNARKVHLGYFSNEIDAARAYDRKAVELSGEFARLNFP